jgi:peptide/nickel transport system permease protein
MLGEKAKPEACKDFMERFGLNDNILVQFARYSSTLLSGNLGDSIKFGRPVGDFILERLPMTLELALGALFFALLVGVPLGIISAYKHRTVVDAGTMVVANLGVSMPVFWLGLLLATLFGVVLKDTPFQLPTGSRLTAGISVPPLWETWHWDISGFPKGLMSFFSNIYTLNSVLSWRWDLWWDAFKHLILPSIALGTIPMAIIARLTRSNLLDVMGLDYVRTARSKGLGERLILFRHAMRNALLPLVTVIGLQFGGLLGGAVLTETVFGLPGIGTFLVQSIFSRDYPVVQGFTLIIAMIFVFVNLLVDISYGYLDPRVRLS